MARDGSTNLPLIPHLISVGIDILLWAALFIVAAGEIWVIGYEQEFSDYVWFLFFVTAFNIYWIVRRRRKRRRLLEEGKFEEFETFEYGEDVKRFPLFRQVLPSVESLVWVALAMFVVILLWSYSNGDSHTKLEDVDQKLAVAGAIYAVFILGRLGWLAAARFFGQDLSIDERYSSEDED